MGLCGTDIQVRGPLVHLAHNIINIHESNKYIVKIYFIENLMTLICCDIHEFFNLNLIKIKMASPILSLTTY